MGEDSVRIIRTGLVSIIFLLICLQGKQLSTLHLTSKSWTLEGDNVIPNAVGTTNTFIPGRHDMIVEETVKLLFMGNETAASNYLHDNPSLKNLKFYTHSLPPGVWNVEQLSECVENWGYNMERHSYRTKQQFLDTFCDWSKSVCNPSNHTRGSQYSTTRLNNNMDAVLANLFSNYNGGFRTFNISEAEIKVVPFPAATNHRCGMQNTQGRQANSLDILLREMPTNLTDSLFLFINDHAALSVDKSFTKGPGQIVVPYVNTNAEYQPHKLISSMKPPGLDAFFAKKRIALAAVFGEKISGNGYARMEFAAKADEFFGSGTLEYNNGTLGGMPVDITIIREKRKMVGEARAMQLYRDSIFCPVFRGDTPNQKRFFDAILSGCIPVVMAHYWKDKQTGKLDTSYFAPGAPLSIVYPWAKGSFGPNHPNMGIDYSQLVVEITEKECGLNKKPGLACLPGTLERWLKDTNALREKQRTIARYARLFSFGMEENAFRHVDAMSALLVRARHFVMHEAAI